MRVTLEIPDATHQRAKVAAAQEGVTLGQFVTEAVRKETARIGRINKKESRQIELERA